MGSMVILVSESTIEPESNVMGRVGRVSPVPVPVPPVKPLPLPIPLVLLLLLPICPVVLDANKFSTFMTLTIPEAKQADSSFPSRDQDTSNVSPKPFSSINYMYIYEIKIYEIRCIYIYEYR